MQEHSTFQMLYKTPHLCFNSSLCLECPCFPLPCIGKPEVKLSPPLLKSVANPSLCPPPHPSWTGFQHGPWTRVYRSGVHLRPLTPPSLPLPKTLLCVICVHILRAGRQSSHRLSAWCGGNQSFPFAFSLILLLFPAVSREGGLWILVTASFQQHSALSTLPPKQGFAGR